MFSVKKYYAGLFKTSTWGTFNTDGAQRAHGATLNSLEEFTGYSRRLTDM